MIETLPGNKIDPHLLELQKNGIKPIMTSIGTIQDLQRSEVYTEKKPNFRRFIPIDGMKEVDWGAEATDLAFDKSLTRGQFTYVISTVDSRNKFSETFLRCTGLAVFGREKETGKDVSFLTHQDPAFFLNEKDRKDNFISDIRKRLEEMKERCEPGTIDAIVVGGTHYGEDTKDNHIIQNYTDSVSLLGQETKQVLGFYPVVINGPKRYNLTVDSVYLDNDNRRAFLIRSEVNHKAANFPTAEAEIHKNEWR